MKIIKIALVLVVITAISLFLLFNQKYFYPEYWLQRQIENYNSIEPLTDIDPGNEVLSYKFVLDRDVDVAVMIFDKGYVFLGTNKWYPNAKNSKGYYFEYNPDVLKLLISEFEKSESELKTQSADDHIGKEYYQLTYINRELPYKDFQVSYNNVKPQKQANFIKDEMLKIAKKVLKGL